MRVLCFGEVLFDIIRGEEYLGGAPFNLAAHLARMGDDVAMVSRVGEDARGARIREEMARLGVKDTFLQTDPACPTGTVDVTLTDGGSPSYVIHADVAWDAVEVDDEAENAVAAGDFGAICYGTLAQRSESAREGLYRLIDEVGFRQALFDVNLRQDFFSEKILRESLDRCTILKLNDDEVPRVSDLVLDGEEDLEDFARSVAEEFEITTVVVTRGAQGCGVLSDWRWEEVPGEGVDVDDTVGAGDAFAAAFLHGLGTGRDAFAAARLANAVGAFVASRPGAIPEYSEEIRKRIESS